MITAPQARRWRDGAYEVWWLSGGCTIQQERRRAVGDEAVIWVLVDGPAQPSKYKLIAYVEGSLEVQFASERGPDSRLEDHSWLGRFYSQAEPQFRVGYVEGEPSLTPPTVRNAQTARTAEAARSGVQPAQFAAVVDPQLIGDPIVRNDAPTVGRRFRLQPRSTIGPSFSTQPDEARGETVGFGTGGLRLIVDGASIQGGAPTTVDLAADRIVIWYGSTALPNLTAETVDDGRAPLEVYLEGDIEFRQGERIIYAERMYYDVTRQMGIVLDVELQTPLPEFDGKIRVRAESLQQLNENRFIARNAMVTSSRFGRPKYWFQSNSVELNHTQAPAYGPGGEPLLDPLTLQPVIDHEYRATSRNNFVYVEGAPIAYWPIFSADLKDPTFYLEGLKVKNDGIFGTQIFTDWNAYQVLGVRNPPAGTKWDFSADYLSKRGPAGGTSFRYQREDFFGFASPHAGFLDAWGVHDTGTDDLGRGRLGLTPEEEFRGRVLGRHRQALPYNLQLTGELGFVSDRNFIEQYFENEWDTFKDQSTGLELKQYLGAQSWSVSADARLNDFFTQTENLPRVDHFLIGVPVFGTPILWHEHSHASYSRLRTAEAPTNPAEAPFFTLEPWEAEVEGEIAATRHELEIPFELGPIKASPFAMGELAHWGQALDGTDLQRYYYRAGLRSSLPMWGVFPEIESDLLNVHGVAHKMTWYSEFAFSEANRNLDELALYDPIEDDANEQFRRRFDFLTFGGPPVPAIYDPRLYGLRSGLGGRVTSPSTEIADDLMTFDFGLRQRLQTKRGPLGARRIVDWVVLDTSATYFPKFDRDNFGEPIGLARYDFRWHVGDRFSVLSDGLYDFFDGGRQTASVGGLLNRPRLGSLYVGYRALQGPVESEVVSLAMTYRMSPKWISTFATSLDISGEGNIGQRFSLTRVGESMLVSLGFNVDEGRDNVGVQLNIEPRFLRGALAGRLGAAIPRYGEYGFE